MEEKTKKCASIKTEIVQELDLYSQSLQMAMVAKDDYNFLFFLQSSHGEIEIGICLLFAFR